ncbi:hypothetical protein CapIbe_003801 [Capra ibex]
MLEEPSGRHILLADSALSSRHCEHPHSSLFSKVSDLPEVQTRKNENTALRAPTSRRLCQLTSGHGMAQLPAGAHRGQGQLHILPSLSPIRRRPSSECRGRVPAPQTAKANWVPPHQKCLLRRAHRNTGRPKGNLLLLEMTLHGTQNPEMTGAQGAEVGEVGISAKQFWEAGAFFPRLVRRRHRSSEKGTRAGEREAVGGRTRAACRTAAPASRRGNAEPGDSPRTGPRAAMPPSVRSGRVLEARSLLRAGEPPPAARLLPASLAGDCGGTPPARRRNRNGAVIHPLPARRQEPRLPAPRLNQLCDRPRSWNVFQPVKKG